MANTQSAKKAIRSSARKRTFNMRRTRAMKEAVKETRDAAKQGKHAEARKLLDTAYKAIDKATKRGVIKKNTASRKKSRLAQFLKKNSS